MPCRKAKHAQHARDGARALSNQSKFIDSTEENRRSVGVDIRVHNVNWQRMRTGAGAVLMVPSTTPVEAEMREPLIAAFGKSAQPDGGAPFSVRGRQYVIAK